MTTDIQAFKSTIPAKGRLLGLDIGRAAIGLALSDETRMIASALSTLERENIHKDTGRLRTILEEHRAVGIVAGWPLESQGTEGESCQMVRQFLTKLLKKIELPVYLQDERFSTSAVMRMLKETDLTRKKREAADDKIAATYILQSALDRLANDPLLYL